jgi:catechol 2,3-dioxygenase-like lactoylglutathione lyase family enzyme
VIKRIWDVTLTVRDLGKAVRFYEDILGPKKKYQFSDYAGFDVGGVELGLKTWGDLEPPRRGEPLVNFLVDNLDQVYRELAAKGVEFIAEPQDTLWGSRIALFQDPDGNVLQLTQIDWPRYFSVCTGQG